MTRKSILTVDIDRLTRLLPTRTTAQLAAELGCSTRAILLCVKEYGLPDPVRRVKGAAELKDREWLSDKVEKGLSTVAIARALGCSASAVSRAYGRLDVVPPTPKCARVRRYKLNAEYFDRVDSSAKAYYLGFIGADGCIERTWGMKLKIHVKDVDILHRLKRDVGFSGPIHRYGSFVCLRLYSVDLVKTLRKYGIVNRKSAIYPFAVGVPKKYMRHYLRGIVDGDGSVRRQVRLVSGSRAFCDGLSVWFYEKYGRHCYRRQEANKWRFVFNRRDAAFVHFLYGASGIRLDRKHASYIEHWVES